nr:uncharacterized protein LOC113819308 [Penaeus vannamei]
MSTEDISESPVSNEGVVFMQATSETKDGRADHVQSPARSLVPPIAFPRQFSPSPDFTPTPARTAWPVAQNQRPPLPPSGPGGATVGMSPSAFESWAVSVEDYGNICGWMPPLAASYVRLLCSGEVQQRIDARVNRQEFRLLSTTAAVDTVRSVVIGPRCVVGAWSDFFTYSQAPSDTICAYVSKCRAMAGECKFQCPKCRCSLDEYMLGKKVVMGLIITDHKALTRIFGDKELKDINNPRILNLKERTLMYSFRIKYLKGKTNCAADALSRYPMLLGHPEESDEADDELVCATIVAAASEAVEGDGGRVVDIQQVEEKQPRMKNTGCYMNVCPTRAGLTARTWSRLLYGHISGCVVTCHAKEILSCTPMMRNNHVWLSPWPSDVLCSLISTQVIRVETLCSAEHASQSTGLALMLKGTEAAPVPGM